MRQNNSDIISTLNELNAIAKSNGNVFLVNEINDELGKLSEGSFYLVVVGQFKRGKSLLINALLGEALLPVGVVPVTSVITLIKYGNEHKASVIFLDGIRKDISPASLQEYITETRNPNNCKNVQYVELVHPAEILQHGIVLVDTPGIGSTFEHNTKTTEQFIPKIDAAIVVLSPEPPITKTEQIFLEQIIRDVKKIFVIFNKIDLVAKDVQEELFAFTQKTISSILGDLPFHFSGVSGLRALEAQQTGSKQLLKQSGIPEFRLLLQNFANEEKSNILTSRSAARTAALIDKARFKTELEMKALQMPAAELNAKIKDIERVRTSILNECEYFSFVIQGRLNALQQQLDEEVHEFGKREIEELSLRAKDRLSTAEVIDKDSLERFIEKQMIADFDSWRSSFENSVRERYQTIVNTYIQKTDEQIEQIAHIAKSLFDIQLHKLETSEPLKWQKRFYYKLDDDALFLELNISRFLFRFLPDRHQQKIFLRRMTEGIQKKVKRTCANLSYEYSYSIQESSRGITAMLQKTLQTALDEIISTLDKATERKVKAEEQSAHIMNHLCQTVNHLLRLQQQLESARYNADRITA